MAALAAVTPGVEPQGRPLGPAAVPVVGAEAVWCLICLFYFSSHMRVAYDLLVPARPRCHPAEQRSHRADGRRHHRLGVVELLPQRVAEINKLDNDGATALMHAAVSSHPAICSACYGWEQIRRRAVWTT